MEEYYSKQMPSKNQSFLEGNETTKLMNQQKFVGKYRKWEGDSSCMHEPIEQSQTKYNQSISPYSNANMSPLTYADSKLKKRKLVTIGSSHYGGDPKEHKSKKTPHVVNVLDIDGEKPNRKVTVLDRGHKLELKENEDGMLSENQFNTAFRARNNTTKNIFPNEHKEHVVKVSAVSPKETIKRQNKYFKNFENKKTEKLWYEKSAW
jgi:hypothetical protein